jgi:hypothetical protein
MTNLNERDFPPLPSKLSRSKQDGFKKPVQARSSGVQGVFATINDLPEELLLSILHYLPGIDLEHFQLASLVGLSRTNRRFHRLVANELYASYNSYFCEPYLFLRTVITNADLANLVQHIDITYGKWAHRERERYMATAQDKKAVKEGLKALGIPDWKNWVTDCNTNSVELDILHTAILMQTPNISSINIRDGQIGNFLGPKIPKWIDLFRRANFKTSLGNMHQFQNLRTLRIEVDELSLSQLAPIFRTPSLRKLHFKSLIEYNRGGEQADAILRYLIPQRCNNLEELQLEQSVLHTDVIDAIVRSARSLKTFNYEMSLDSVPFLLDPDEVVDSKKLVVALHSQKTSLENLLFTTDSDPEVNFPGAFNFHEGLREFSALKHLSCPLGSIVNVTMGSAATLIDKLPLSLIKFHAIVRKHSTDKDVLHTLEHATADFSTDMPLLQEIRLTVDMPGSWLKYDWARLITPFSRTGIDLVIEDEQEEGDSWSESWKTVPGKFRAVPSDVDSESSGEVSLYSN